MATDKSLCLKGKNMRYPIYFFLTVSLSLSSPIALSEEEYYFDLGLKSFLFSYFGGNETAASNFGKHHSKNLSSGLHIAYGLVDNENSPSGCPDFCYLGYHLTYLSTSDGFFFGKTATGSVGIGMGRRINPFLLRRNDPIDYEENTYASFDFAAIYLSYGCRATWDNGIYLQYELLGAYIPIYEKMTISHNGKKVAKEIYDEYKIDGPNVRALFLLNLSLGFSH
jgi:hypothetical protein